MPKTINTGKFNNSLALNFIGVMQILERTTVDGIVFAGDSNLVESTFPMALLAGP